MKTAFFVIIN